MSKEDPFAFPWFCADAMKKKGKNVSWKNVGFVTNNIVFIVYVFRSGTKPFTKKTQTLGLWRDGVSQHESFKI